MTVETPTFDELVTKWLKTEFRDVMARFFIREVYNYAQVRDVPLTAVYMAEYHDYGYYI